MARGPHADVWVGTPDGLNHIFDRRVRQYTSSNGLPDDFVRSVLVDAHGAVWAGTRRGLARIEGFLWIGTSAGLSHLRGNRIESFSIHQNQTGNAVTAIAQEDDGTIWVGVHGEGLSRFTNGRFSPIQSSSIPA